MNKKLKYLLYAVPAIVIGLFFGVKAFADNPNFWLLSNNKIKPLTSSWDLQLGVHTIAPSEVDGAMYYNSSSKIFFCGANGSWQNCATSSSTGISTLNGLGTSSQTFATGTATGIGLTVTSSGSTHTFTPTVSSGYTIPLQSTLDTFSTYAYGTSTYVSFGYASTTFPSLTYASSSYATLWNLKPGTNVTISTSSGVTINGSSDSYIRGLLSGTAPITYNNGTGAIGCTTASSGVTGCLSGTDWNTFNNKQAAGSYLTSAITSISALTGPAVAVATSSDTNITISISTTTANTLTFIPGFTGTLAAGRLNGNVVQAFTNDTNVTATISAQNATLGWTGLLSVSRGGTGATSLTANDILFGNGTSPVATSSSLTWDGTKFSTTNASTSALSVSGNTYLTGLTGQNCLGTSANGLIQAGSCGGGTGNSAWTIGNGLIYNATSTDLVGIGTITPTTTLTIQGKAGTNPFQINSSTGSSLLSVDQTGNITGTGSLTLPSQINFNSSVFTQFQATQANINLNFKTVAGTGNIVFTPNAIDTLWIMNNQRVGLNSSTPNATLVVQGTSSSPTLDILRVASSSGVSQLTVASNGSTTLSSLTAGGIVQSTVAGALFNSNQLGNASTTGLTVTGLSTLQNVTLSGTLNVTGTSTLATTTIAGINVVGRFDKSFQIASTTLDTTNLQFSNATTTWNLWNPSYPVTLKKLYCKTDTGTLLLNFGGNLLSCTSSGASSTPSTNYAVEADVNASLGTAASTPNRVRVTATFQAQ